MIEASGVDIGVYSTPPSLAELKSQVQTFRDNPTSMVIERSDELERAWQEGKYGVLFYAQKHFPLRGSISPTRDWYRQGLRILQLAYGDTWDPDNRGEEEKCAGVIDEPELGLTALGREVVTEMNRLHMLVDVSHLSKAAVLGATALSSVPVLATLACARAVTDNVRNKTDEELRAIAGSGGVIGATPIVWMIDRDGDGKAGIDDFVAHINHMVDIAGIDHVGLGADAILNGWKRNSRHYADEHCVAVDRWKRVARKLLQVQDNRGRRRYAERDVKKILGLNFLRVFEEVL
jgi:membrane dipeptidase